MTAIRYLSVTGLVAANIFGFPEVQAVEGIGGVLAAASAPSRLSATKE